MRYLHLPLFLVALLTVGCSGSGSPTAPNASAAPLDRTSAAAPTQLVGSQLSALHGNRNGDVDDDDGDDHHPGEGHGKFVEGNAVVTSVAAGTNCPTLTFVAEGHTIKTSATTRYSSGTCEDIRPGRPLTIQGMMLTDGTVNATHVVLKGNHPTEVEGNTAILSLVAGTSCPTLSFLVEGHTVTTNATTEFRKGTCADLKPGVRVQVKGLLQVDGSVTAMRIQFKKDDDDDDDDDEDDEHDDD